MASERVGVRLTVQTLPLPTGLRGNIKTLAYMREFVIKGSEDPRTRLLALDIVRECTSRDYECEAREIHAWILRNIRFRRDPVGVEWLQDVERTLLLQSGDCDDIAVLTAALLRSLGHRVAFKVGGYGKAFSHVWVADFINGVWVDIDASINCQFGWAKPFPNVATIPI